MLLTAHFASESKAILNEHQQQNALSEPITLTNKIIVRNYDSARRLDDSHHLM